jgi:ribosomal protein L3 glutamine methyltransferase
MSEHNDVGAHLHSLRDFIRWGASRMNEAGVHFGHGTDNAIDEAAALILQTLHLPADLHPDYLAAALTPPEKQHLLNIFRRRIEERMPAAYLTRRSWFMGLPFYVDERVLIPRSPIAELIEHQFSPWIADPDDVTAILDLCSGSGCIGIACAYAFPAAQIDLSDISDAALQVAQRNVDEHKLGDRVELIESDLFESLQGRRYDIIVSNPPYVGNEELAQLPAEYAHEPRLALASGEQGLDAVLEILYHARQYLNDQGILIVEVGNAQFALTEALPNVPFSWLEFERGGDGVFLLTANQLRNLNRD